MTSRTEQAAPSVASGVEKDGASASSEHYDEVKATLQGAHSIMETVSRLERRVGPVGSHARGYTHKITNALRHLEALAAPGAAIAAREQERLLHFADAVHEQLHANERTIQHLCNELANIARTADRGGLHAAITKRVRQTITTPDDSLASRQEAPAASDTTLVLDTVEAFRQAELCMRLGTPVTIFDHEFLVVSLNVQAAPFRATVKLKRLVPL